MEKSNQYLIVVAGPTAVGKTAAAIAIAQHFATEIVSADSRQFYKEMSIGTAAPTAHELHLVQHHFVQQLSIHEPYDVATYAQQALQTLQHLFNDHDVVILTGGSGLFIDAVCFGLDEIPHITPETRQKVNLIFQYEGLEGLQSKVKKVDLEYYNSSDLNNPRRLQRALEVFYESGKPFSSFRKKEPQSREFTPIFIGLTLDRNLLIERINHRCEQMMKDGLVQEALELYPFRHLNALKTVGYTEIFDHFAGKATLSQSVERIKISTRQYAKRQMTWFKKNEKYRWFSPESTDEMITYIENHIGGCKNSKKKAV
ncbi:MAG: tRNA (adenosine(37)-N6)-dimethylallyltransferase MiaA [Bacteroidales bacterium]|nr:tRNA (adenosine(37)-N6)-dimethylallyltransferase MiaA [Bacteroidales bacterium]